MESVATNPDTRPIIRTMPPAEAKTEDRTGPTRLPSRARLALARVHPAALGTALGCVLAVWVFALTMWTALAGSTAARRALALLSQYWPGYRVTLPGAALGLVYGLVFGFVAGYAIAATRNAIIRLYVTYLRRRAEQQQMNDILDHLG